MHYLSASPVRAVLLGALVTLAPSCAATFEPAELEPTPQRPRVSRNTKTVAADSIELEAGVLLDPNDFFDTPVTLKYGLTDEIEYFFESAVLRSIDFPGDDETGVGDVALGLRHRFREGEDGGPKFAYEVAGKIPTGDEPDGRGTGGRDLRLPTFFSGSTDFRLAGIVEQSQGDVDVVGYGALNALGSPFGGTVYQLLLASHAAMPITDADTVFAEVVGTFTEGASSEFFVQGGLYRRIAANMTIDAAAGVGLEDDAPAFFATVGLTTSFGYLR